jgi:hypothetical protein
LQSVSNQYPDYTNPHVQDKRRELGPFEYGTQSNDGVKREVRKMATLESGARYEGEWNIETNLRDGKGVQFW